MFKKIILSLVAIATFLTASSEMPYPADWKNYKNATTVLTGIGALPGCDADVSSFPKIYQETVATYCAIKPGGPGAVAVLVDEKSMPAFKKRDGKFADGATLILHLKDIKALFVTQYKGGKPLYGAYSEDGKDISAPKGSGLNPQDCRVCHTGYSAFCLNGQCSTHK